jgi:hypothetical protein
MSSEHILVRVWGASHKLDPIVNELAREPLPETGPAIVKLLIRAADKESPKEDVLRLASEILEQNGQADLLSQVGERAQSLPSNHPLRRAIHSLSEK